MAIKLTAAGQQLLDQNQREWMTELDKVKHEAGYKTNVVETGYDADTLRRLFAVDVRRAKERIAILEDLSNYEDDGL